MRYLKVGQKPEIIEALAHNVTFATDADINARILTKFRLFEWLTPSDTANTYMMQSVIDQWAEYCDKLYATTQYTYNPIENYDRQEEGKETTSKHKGTKRSFETDTKTVNTPRVESETDDYGYGLGSDVNGTPVGRTVNKAPTGTDEARTTGTAATNYTLEQDIDANTYDKDVLEFDQRRTHGNIGATTTQQMIQQERDIIIDVLDLYVSKFGECFDLSRDVIFGWLEDEEEEP